MDGYPSGPRSFQINSPKKYSLDVPFAEVQKASLLFVLVLQNCACAILAPLEAFKWFGGVHPTQELV